MTSTLVPPAVTPRAGALDRPALSCALPAVARELAAAVRGIGSGGRPRRARQRAVVHVGRALAAEVGAHDPYGRAVPASVVERTGWLLAEFALDARRAAEPLAAVLTQLARALEATGVPAWTTVSTPGQLLVLLPWLADRDGAVDPRTAAGRPSSPAVLIAVRRAFRRRHLVRG